MFERATPISLDGGHRAREGALVLVGGGKRGARVLREIGRPDVARDVLEADREDVVEEDEKSPRPCRRPAWRSATASRTPRRPWASW